MGGFFEKRLAIFPDCAPEDFLSHPAFKKLTGGDRGIADIKGGARFNFPILTKIIVSSNETLSIRETESDLRRVIYVQMRPVPAERVLPQGEIEKRLWGERAVFVDFCIWMYNQSCPRHGVIPVSRQAALEEAENTTEWVRNIVSRYFVIGKDKTCAGHQMDYVLRDFCHLNLSERNDFKKLTKKFYPISKRRLAHGIYYYGIGYTGDEIQAQSYPQRD